MLITLKQLKVSLQAVKRYINKVLPTKVSELQNDAGYLTQHQDISGKANTSDLATVATSGDYNDLTNKPTIPTVPTNVSAFTNDAGYLTSAPVSSVNNKTGAVSLSAADVGALPDNTEIHNIPSGGSTGQMLVKKSNTNYDAEWTETYSLPTASDSTLGGVKIGSGISINQNGVISIPTNISGFVNDVGYLTEHQSLSNYVTLNGTQTISGTKTFSAEVKMSAGGSSDICNGVLCAFKTNRAQITNFVTRNLYTNNSDITFYNYTGTSGQAPSNATPILTVEKDGTITAGAGGFVGDLTGNATSLTGLTASVSELNYLSGATSNIQDQINAIPTPMQFKGTVGTGGTETSLPLAAAANTGYVYKVITDGTYQGNVAKVGDMLISNGSTWVLVPSGDDASDVQSVDGKTGVVTILPTGGTSGQYLKKSSSTDYAVEWGTVQESPEIFIGSTTPSGYTVYIDPDGSTVVGEGVSF